MPGVLQQLDHVVGQIYRIPAVDRNGLAGKLLHVVVEDLGVFLLLTGRELEDGLQHMQLLLLAECGGEGVAVAGLTLTGKGPHQIPQRFAGFEFYGHHRLLLVMVMETACASQRNLYRKQAPVPAEACPIKPCYSWGS